MNGCVYVDPTPPYWVTEAKEQRAEIERLKAELDAERERAEYYRSAIEKAGPLRYNDDGDPYACVFCDEYFETDQHGGGCAWIRAIGDVP